MIRESWATTSMSLIRPPIVAGPISRNRSPAIVDSKVGGGEAGRAAGEAEGDGVWAPANETTDNNTNEEALIRFTKPNILIIKCPQKP
jgi:hypothetical protein